MTQGRINILLQEIIDKRTTERAAEIAAASNNAQDNTVTVGQMPGGFPEAAVEESPVLPVSETAISESAPNVAPDVSTQQPQESGGVMGWGWLKGKMFGSRARHESKVSGTTPKDDAESGHASFALTRLNDGQDHELLARQAEDVFETMADIKSDTRIVMNKIALAKRSGFDINHQKNVDGDNVLHAAVKQRGLMMIDPLLQQEGIVVDALNENNETALQLAVTYDDSDSVSRLLEAGAVDYGSSRATLLGMAVGNDGIRTVNMLLARGMRADENLPGGRSALEIAEAMVDQGALNHGEAILRALYADSDRMAGELNQAMNGGDIETVKELLAVGVSVMRFSEENMQRWMQHLNNREREEAMTTWCQTPIAALHPDIVMMIEKMKRLQAMKSNHVKQKRDIILALETLKQDIIHELEAEVKRVEKLGKDISDVHDSSPVLLAIQTSELLDKLMAVKDEVISDADFQKRQHEALKYYEANIPDMPRRHKLWKSVGVVLLAVAAFLLTGGILFGITVAAPVVIPVAAMIGAAAGAGVITSLISGAFFMRSPAMRRHAEVVAVKSEKFVDMQAKAARIA